MKNLNYCPLITLSLSIKGMLSLQVYISTFISTFRIFQHTLTMKLMNGYSANYSARRQVAELLLLYSIKWLFFACVSRGKRDIRRQNKCQLSNYRTCISLPIRDHAQTWRIFKCVFPDTPFRSGQDLIAADYNRNFLRSSALLTIKTCRRACMPVDVCRAD